VKNRIWCQCSEKKWR